MTFALLPSISFYVSSRRVRICVHKERTPKISLDELDHDDVFTVQAVTRRIVFVGQLDESISSLESIHSGCRVGYRPRWVESRAQILNQTNILEAVVDFVSQAWRAKTKNVDLLSFCRDKHRGLSSMLVRMKFIRRCSISKCTFLSLLWPWASPRRVLKTNRWTHPRGSTTIHSWTEREDEEKMKHRYSQCALDRSNRTKREDQDENKHLFHRSIDRHTKWSEKPSLRRNRSIFFSLTWISVYISSSRVRMCVNEDRGATISFSQLDCDDTFSLRATMDGIFDCNRLADGIQQRNWANSDLC